MEVFESADAAVSTETLKVPIRGSFDLRRFSGDAALVIGAAITANLFSYVFHFTLSRRLGPDHYGTLLTMMAIAGIFNVLGSSVGTVAMQETAKMWASHLDTAIAPFLRRTAIMLLALAIMVALVLTILSLPLRAYLHIPQVYLWWLLALYVAFAVFAGFARGAAQGAHRFGIFSASLISEGVAKVVIALGFVALGFGVAGALGGLIASLVIAVIVVMTPMISGGEHRAWTHNEHVRLGGETLKVLAVTAATTALLFVDMLFAKHHFSGDTAGYFGAAGTVARTIPYGVGLVALILMPKAAAARHASRDSLAHILRVAAGIAVAGIAVGLMFIELLPHPLIRLTYGPTFSAAAPLLRIYAIDEALFALYGLAISYLVAIARYEVVGLLVAAVIVESLGMALFGTTPVRLLSIAIVINALLVPTVWAQALRSLRSAPQAVSPQGAETKP